MKLFVTVAAILRFALVAVAQQQETYNAGVFTDIFHTNAPAYFSFANGTGYLTTRGIQPGNTMYYANYLRKGPFNLSMANAAITLSTLFKVIKPTSTNLGVSTLHLGVFNDLTPSAFVSSGIGWMLDPKSLVDTGSGFYFDTTVHVGVSGGGFGWGTFGTFLLRSNNWYKATFEITRVNSTTLKLWGYIDDYGVNGQTYLGRVDTVGTDSASGSAMYPFTQMTSDQTFYPALHGMSSGGLKVIDQTTIAGALAPAIATDISLVAKLETATQAGVRYFIHSSPDLTNWTAIEGPITGGGLLTRYYPATGAAKYFRVTQE